MGPGWRNDVPDPDGFGRPQLRLEGEGQGVSDVNVLSLACTTNHGRLHTIQGHGLRMLLGTDSKDGL